MRIATGSQTAVAVMAVVLLVTYLWFGLYASVVQLGPPGIQGGVLRTAGERGEVLVLLTSQWERRYLSIGGVQVGSSSRRSNSARLHVDLWWIDVASARPLRRQRLSTDKQLSDMSLLGIERGVLWLRAPDILGIRLRDGARMVDRERIGHANPALAAMLPELPNSQVYPPDNMQPIRFSPEGGLVLLLNDARRVRIDPHTSTASEVARLRGDGSGVASPSSTDHTEQGTSSRTLTSGNQWRAMVRGIDIERGGGKQWIGLAVADPEALQAKALSRSDPESVFVLHRDQLGDTGRWQLSRVAASSGRVLWHAALPLTHLSLWLPGERTAIAIGQWNAAERSPMVEPNEEQPPQFVSIDMSSGKVAGFNLDLLRDWPFTDPPEAP